MSEVKNIIVEMTFSRSTKNTHLFTNEEEDAKIKSLYIQQSGMKEAPKKIVVTIEQ